MTREQKDQMFRELGRAVHQQWSKSAIARVYRFVKSGRIPPAADFRCADCDAAAECYDHRDYGQPLVVAPVCWPCNLRRGSAVLEPASVLRDYMPFTDDADLVIKVKGTRL